MASLAGDITVPGLREIAALLAPFPGRASIVTRIALICALTVLVTSAYGTPGASTAVYIVFFLNRPDRVTSVVTCVALLLLVTAIIGTVMAVAIFCINEPALRVASMALLSFGLLFVTSASKLRPVGAIVAMIVGFGLDELGLAPIGEAATRGLLYAWLMVAIPIGVSIVVNVLCAPSPRRLACAQLARRLRLAARRLTGSATEAEREAFDACLREGEHQLLAWLKFSKLEGTSTDADCVALRQAVASTTAILLAVDLAASEPGAQLSAACTARLAETMEQMAAMLDAGGYPVDITVDVPAMSAIPAVPAIAGTAAASPALAALVFDDLREALEHFAQPPAASEASPAPAPASPAPAEAEASAGHAPARAGFFDADAFTNRDHVRYALKTTAAAMFCYLLYQQLDWQGIHTCFITCYMVSLGTTAETVEKLTLRIAGCLMGALLGTAAIVFVTPALTSVGELMALVFAGAWLAAWVGVGSPRIAYAGLQIAFAFFLCVIQGAAPAFDLTLARDRAIGILIGNVVVYLIFTRVWPVSIASRIDTAFDALMAQWTRIAKVADASGRRALVAGALAQYGVLRQNLGLVHYEPSWVRPAPAWIASRRRALAELGALEGPLFLAAGCAGTATQARLGELVRRIAPGEGEEDAGGSRADDAQAERADAQAHHDDTSAPRADTQAHRDDTPAPRAAAAAQDAADPGVNALLDVIDARFGEIAEAARLAEPQARGADARP
ncbi:FUSC family protein [Paraburkholderia pallida]|uniref:FUSC family protein n=1 Tax=Paraburkholderia pallida TaxID=2547399 RepID=A0A4V1B053_9BURK|nr:FUSC family protein [Paraburkholderia pallida]QBR01573.1 FUSC family protein [Paraburkholderia pallida]